MKFSGVITNMTHCTLFQGFHSFIKTVAQRTTRFDSSCITQFVRARIWTFPMYCNCCVFSGVAGASDALHLRSPHPMHLRAIMYLEEEKTLKQL